MLQGSVCWTQNRDLKFFWSLNLMNFLKMKALILQKIVTKKMINILQTILYQIMRTFSALGKLNQFPSFSFYNRRSCVSSFSLILGSGILTLFISNKCTFFIIHPFIHDLGHVLRKNEHKFIDSINMSSLLFVQGSWCFTLMTFECQLMAKRLKIS